jgi:hypothetical protein
LAALRLSPGRLTKGKDANEHRQKHNLRHQIDGDRELRPLLFVQKAQTSPLGDDYDLRREIDACHVAGRLSESSLFASDAVAVRVVMTPISWVPFGGRRETHHFCCGTIWIGSKVSQR